MTISEYWVGYNSLHINKPFASVLRQSVCTAQMSTTLLLYIIKALNRIRSVLAYRLLRWNKNKNTKYLKYEQITERSQFCLPHDMETKRITKKKKQKNHRTVESSWSQSEGWNGFAEKVDFESGVFHVSPFIFSMTVALAIIRKRA